MIKTLVEVTPAIFLVPDRLIAIEIKNDDVF